MAGCSVARFSSVSTIVSLGLPASAPARLDLPPLAAVSPLSGSRDGHDPVVPPAVIPASETAREWPAIEHQHAGNPNPI